MPSVTAISQDPRILPALRSFHENHEQLIDEIIAVQQIAAPTFDESRRSAFVEEQFKSLGLERVMIDGLGNVYGCIAGSAAQPQAVVVTAHSDTVFPIDTDLTVTREDGRIHGPGIADNSAGVAGVLHLAATFKTHNMQTAHDVWFVVNVCEEGLGDLRGMRAVTERFANAAAFIVLEGGMYGYLLHEAIGVKRYKVTVTADGGHSWSDFGRTSAIHVLGHIISQIDSIRVPSKPKTTFNVGTIAGGTSINTIAAHASLTLDLRAEDPANLRHLIGQFDTLIRRARRRYDGANIEIEVIGDRPAGAIPRNSPLVKMADEALTLVGCPKIQYLRGSTDANVPLSRNLPAICIGLTRSANAHRLDEYLETADLPRGMQQLLLVTLAAANYK